MVEKLVTYRDDYFNALIMFLLKLLKQTICVYIIFVSLFFSFCNGDGKTCDGGDIENLGDDCQMIVKHPLVITKNSNSEFTKRKLGTITHIHAGIQILETNIVNLEFPNLEEVKNPSGPAILFRENSNLQRFDASKLVNLSGTPNAIHFDNDSFIRSVFEGKNVDSFRDFQNLKRVAEATKPTTCNDDFYAIQDYKESTFMDEWTITIFLLLIHIILLVILIVVCCCLSNESKLKLKSGCKKKKQEKKTKESRGNQKELKPLNPLSQRSDLKPSEISKALDSNQSKQSAPSPLSGTPTSRTPVEKQLPNDGTKP